jgi:hypothetical protein
MGSAARSAAEFDTTWPTDDVAVTVNPLSTAFPAEGICVQRAFAPDV